MRKIIYFGEHEVDVVTDTIFKDGEAAAFDVTFDNSIQLGLALIDLGYEPATPPSLQYFSKTSSLENAIRKTRRFDFLENNSWVLGVINFSIVPSPPYTIKIEGKWLTLPKYKG